MTPAAAPLMGALCLLAVLQSAAAQDRPVLHRRPASFRIGKMDYPRVSPFRGMRAIDGGLHVQVDDDTWYELVSLNGIAATDLVAWCKRTVGEDRWWKRITEDLVEVLAASGNPPEDEVDLELRDLGTGKVVARRGVAMTGDNRQRLWRANREDRRDEQPVRAADLAAVSWRADLEHLGQLLDERFAYRSLTGADPAELLRDAGARLGNGEVSTTDFGLEATRVLAAFGDGHSRMADARAFFTPGFLPFLVEETADGFVAVRPDRTGFVSADHPYLVALDGVAVEPWLDAAIPFVAQGSPQFVRRRATRMLRFAQFLRSRRGTEPTDTIRATLRAPDGETETVTVRISQRYPTFGEWPRRRSQTLLGGIGYLRIPQMLSNAEFLAGIDARMAEFRTTRGLIIDVRGNGGGSRAALRRLFPYFMSKDDAPHVANIAAYRKQRDDDPHHADGYLQNRWLYPANWSGWDAQQRDAIAGVAKGFEPDWRLPAGAFSGWHYMLLDRSANPSAYHYDQPVVVLLDGGCFSATDIFLGAFQGWRGVTLMGTPSGGGSGRALRYRLPNSGLQLRLSSMASFRTNGERYDGKGITPDVPAAPVATDFTGETDSVLEAALSRLRG